MPSSYGKNNERIFSYSSPGIGSVGSYQSSARPYLSHSIDVPQAGTVIKVDLPNITRFVTILNAGTSGVDEATMRVGFSENGVNGTPNNNYFVLNNGESYSGDWKVRAIYFRVDTGATNNATASIVAGLTGIDNDELTNNWSGSSGVG
jgi:hypothetical protein